MSKKSNILIILVDVRTCLKGRLPIKLFISKAKDIYADWCKRQPQPIENKLLFSKSWIRDWMKEYNVSLQKPNKRFAINQQDRVERLLEYLKNIMRIRRTSNLR